MLFFHSLPVPELWEWFFFIPFPFPNCGNGFFSFPSRSRILGIDFFIPFPFPNFGNGFFSFPSRSRIEGMGFFNSLPVPELREWNYPFPFPFPNSQMSFPLTPASHVKDMEVELGRTRSQVESWMWAHCWIHHTRSSSILKGAKYPLRQQVCVLRAREPGGGCAQCSRWQVSLKALG